MSKVTVVSRPNRITIASKGVQGARGPEGPQGAQGLQGPKGDTGDATPEALAARDAAVGAASAAAGSASTASAAATTATDKAAEAAASAALAEQARLLGATIGFATKADMDASLVHPAGTLALVTNDTNPTNSVTYRKTGASGSGAWVQSADRVTQIEQNTEKLVTTAKNLYDPAAVISGYWYSGSGAQANNAIRRVTPKIAVPAGQKLAISGISAAMQAMSGTYRRMNFWNGESHISTAGYPMPEVFQDWMVLDVPAGATSVSLNLPDTSAPLPPVLQVEVASRPTLYEPRRKTATALPESQFDNLHFARSTKNLFDGRVFGNRVVSTTAYSNTGDAHRVATSFIPVEHGKTYTVSGLNPELVPGANLGRVLGVGNPSSLAVAGTEYFGAYSGSTFTFTVTNPATKFVAVQLSTDGSRYLEAYTLRVQVEEGVVATAYEPYQLVRGTQPSLDALEASILKYVDGRTDPLVTRRIASLDQVPIVGPGVTPVTPTRSVGPYGAAYVVGSTSAQDAAGCSLFAAVTGLRPGARSVYAHIVCRDSAGSIVTPKVKTTPFSVPSGQLMYEPPDASVALDDYVHPSIAYSATPVAGYKYWMVASILPGYVVGGAWEDEDVFVSNDAKTWLRIKSLYEPNQAHHAPGLSLPPHALVATGGRRHGFLPVPGPGDVIEISVPATVLGPAIDRQNITLTGTPFKHDPAILIEGGYVYIYHTFHLSYVTHPGGNNKFIVCTRTSDGVNWECVRTDGSTFPLDTTEASRRMFTKDDEGRYNFLWFPGVGGYSNPEVVKYGADDFEFIYGENHTRRYAGTSPWSFDFLTSLPFASTSSGNHPGVMVAGGDLYLLNDSALYRSSNRGASFTAYPFYPAWRGGVGYQTYKKAMCVGEGGRIIVVDTARRSVASPTAHPTGFNSTRRQHKMIVQEHPSITAFTGMATGGIGDAYLDAQIDQVNHSAGTLVTKMLPYIGNASTTTGSGNPHQRVKVADLTVGEGDTIYIYASMVARSGGSVSFNGLEIV